MWTSTQEIVGENNWNPKAASKNKFDILEKYAQLPFGEDKIDNM